MGPQGGARVPSVCAHACALVQRGKDWVINIAGGGRGSASGDRRNGLGPRDQRVKVRLAFSVVGWGGAGAEVSSGGPGTEGFVARAGSVGSLP